jgi:hypothetical protein
MNLEKFLHRKVCVAAILHAFGSLAVVVIGIIATFLTFWVIYGIIWWGFQWCLPHSHQTRLICSGAVLAIFFIGNARADREYFSSYKIDTLDGRAPYTIDVPNVGILSNLNYFSPNTVSSLAKVICQLLFIAPQLLSASWRLAVRSAELRRINVAPAARLVGRLLSSKGRVPFVELFPLMDQDSLNSALRDLRMLDAIQFLDSSPAGVMLTSAFREEISV